MSGDVTARRPHDRTALSAGARSAPRSRVRRPSRVGLAARRAVATRSPASGRRGAGRVALAAQARALARLPVRRASPPARRRRLAIFAHNAAALLGVFAAAADRPVARCATAAGPGAPSGSIAAPAGELLLAGAIAANVLVVGAALGAYGDADGRAPMLPHGPVELAAYALALALYLQGRRRALPAASPGRGRGG